MKLETFLNKLYIENLTCEYFFGYETSYYIDFGHKDLYEIEPVFDPSDNTIMDLTLKNSNGSDSIFNIFGVQMVVHAKYRIKRKKIYV